MKNSTLLSLLLPLALATTPLAGQTGGNLAGVSQPGQVSLENVDSRLVSRFPASVATRIGSLVDSARIEGLPTEPLILRALEGGAKRVPADRIHVALVRLRDAMRRAFSVLGNTVASSDLATAAAALQTGLAPARLLELVALRAEDSITVPLGAYLDLVARGVDSGRAWDRVVSLAEAGAEDRDYGRIDPAGMIARQPGDRE